MCNGWLKGQESQESSRRPGRKIVFKFPNNNEILMSAELYFRSIINIALNFQKKTKPNKPSKMPFSMLKKLRKWVKYSLYL